MSIISEFTVSQHNFNLTCAQSLSIHVYQDTVYSRHQLVKKQNCLNKIKHTIT